MSDNGEKYSDRQALELAKAAAKEKMIAEPSPANVAAFEAARGALEKLTAEAAPAPAGEVFGNRVKALRWLQGQGYKIKKSKFYADCKVGLCKMAADGSVAEDELNRYVKRAGLMQPAAIDGGPANDVLSRKNEKEIERLEEQINKLRREREIIEGRFVERDLVEMELAGKCAVLEAGIRHLFHVRLVDWIEAKEAQGLPAAVDLAQQDLNAQFNEFASLDGFEVLIGGADDKLN